MTNDIIVILVTVLHRNCSPVSFRIKTLKIAKENFPKSLIGVNIFGLVLEMVNNYISRFHGTLKVRRNNRAINIIL